MTTPRHGPATMRSVFAAILGLGALFLASWIVIPGPTYFFLTFSVGAPEISAWLLALSAAGGALAIVDVRTRATSRVAVALSIAAFCLSALPLGQSARTIRRFDKAMSAALGSEALAVRPAAMRQHPLSILDLVRGIPLGQSRITRRVPLATVDGVPLTVDVYQPATAGPHPIIVQIYGGAWQRGQPSSFANAAQWLAAHGYVVFAIDYRHAPAFRWPAQIDDVRLALAWIRDHAAEYRADTARVALTGRSAGAHLAMMAAYQNAPLPISGVVSYYGPVDLVDAYLNPPRPDPLRIREVEDTLFGAPLDSLRSRFREASPIVHTARPQPPTLLVYGGRDHIVEPRYGARMHDSLVAAGTTAVYLEIPWADHAFDEVFNGPSNQLSLYYTERFLAWAFESRSTRH